MTTKLGILLLCAGILIGISIAAVSVGSNPTPANPSALLDSHALAANVGTSAQTYVLPVSQTEYLPIRDFNISDPIMQSRAALLVDKETAKTLYALNPDQELPIASVTKLMSAVVILEHLDLDAVYQAHAEDLNVDGLGADLLLDERLKGRDLFQLMLIKSSNDAAFMFASAARDQGLDFVPLMNQKAKELGMIHTFYNDPAGLDDGSTHSTASDLLKLMQYIDRYPIIWQTLIRSSADIVSTDGLTHHHIVSTNKLLGVIPDIMGGKTGNTDGALGTMVLIAGVPGTRHAIIGIILGSRDRFGEMKTLINWGKRAHSWEQ